MDEEEKKEAERDYDRSREELLSKIARLNELLKEREQQLVDEKDKRKKKEKKWVVKWCHSIVLFLCWCIILTSVFV